MISPDETNTPIEDTRIKEACGLFGIYNHTDASTITAMGLLALQHRGEEAAGIASFDGKKIRIHAGQGKVNHVFNDSTIKTVPGKFAIGHTRYSVTGSPNVKNVQPLVGELARGTVAVAHNGNLTNSIELKEQLELNGSIFQTTMDSETVLHLLAHSKKPTMKEAIIDAVRQLRGSFSLLILTKDAIVAIRDPHGIRPLCLATLNDSTIFCSETAAIDLVGATYIGEIRPGEMVTISNTGLQREQIFEPVKQASCIFEMIYFARPDSLVFDQSVYKFRKSLGAQLYKEAPVEADMIVPVPDSGMYAALGYSQASGIPFETAITRNHYVGRSFIQPEKHLRELFVRVKLNPIKNVINNKRIVIVDDSIVRGTTTLQRVKTLRAAGAKEVHMRISCPPIKNPCYYGIDFPTRSELIANNFSVEETAKFLNLDSLAYISNEGMHLAAGTQNSYCDACFSGNYPIEIPQNFSKEALE